jgi:biopolymer transport protein ExbB
MLFLRKKLLYRTGLLLALTLPLCAQDFNAAAAQAQADLKASLTELSEVRQHIAAEKIPLMRSVSHLEDEVRQQTAELERVRRLRDNKDLGLNRLREQVNALHAQNEYTASLLDEFVRSFETRIDYSEVQLYSAVTEEARLALDDPELNQAERFEKQLNAIELAIGRLDSLVGGYRFEGQARSPEGTIETGEFSAFGPAVYFASRQSELAGITYNKLNAAEAAIARLGETHENEIRQFIETGAGRIPLDPTLGKALKISKDNDSLAEHLAKGGSVGSVIIGLGFVCLILGGFKIYKLNRFTTPTPEHVQQILHQLAAGDRQGAQANAARMAGAAGELLQTGVASAGEKRSQLEELLYEKILAARPKLERFLPFIALTAAAAPLLGLLGTVTGMIKTFNLITLFGTGDAKSLSTGISEALVTTELGLIVAIPALLLHGVLTRMARQKLAAMEQTAVGFINGVMSTKAKDSGATEL